MDTILAPIVWLVGSLLGLVWWLVMQLFWIAVWLLLPVAVVVFLALRIAERAAGRDTVRAWVKAHTLKYGADAWARARRLTFALGALPFRVLAWFLVYALWHSIVSLAWRPKWSPWIRAWGKRWRPPAAERPRRA